MEYFTKIVGRPLSEAEAYDQATPRQRAMWWPHGAPVKAQGAGPAGVDLVDGGRLDVAMAAGRAAHAAGFGPSRADGLYGCGHCAGCDFGGPDACRRPQSKASARLRAGQAATDRLDQAEADLAELQRTIYREVHRRQLT